QEPGDAFLDRRGAEHMGVSGADQRGALGIWRIAGNDRDRPEFVVAPMARPLPVIGRCHTLASILVVALVSSCQNLAPVGQTRTDLALETTLDRLVIGPAGEVVGQLLLFDDGVL